ncbi:hypothetical protein E2C01_070534 [Portunus trituberculatus]|uniref:Uncharacterized protein n=1 Tax=Portunus trituberculatus TaxID=210409 RepID=A0A5B7I2J4_PORTR|nr:hypothetical protein [Portunus trituberculatus]
MEKRLTLVLRIERGSDTLDFTKAAAQDPQGNTGSNFFIGECCLDVDVRHSPCSTQSGAPQGAWRPP